MNYSEIKELAEKLAIARVASDSSIPPRSVVNLYLSEFNQFEHDLKKYYRK